MPIKLNGSTSGYSQIQAAAVAGNNTLTLPTTTGNLLADDGSGALTIQTINSGTSNALTLQSNNTTAMTIDTSQNVGIGTTSPGAKLEVRGTTGAYSFFSGTSQRIVFGDVSGMPYIQAYNIAGSNSGLAFYNYSSEAMRIDTSGNVGIGTNSPGNRLHISGASNAVSGVSIQSTGASGRKYTIYSASTGGLYFANDTGGGDQMVLDSSGNLLIGTTTLPIATTRVGIKGSSSAGIGLISLVNTQSSTKVWTNGPDGNGNFCVLNDSSLGMYMGYGATAWTANSDERLKTDLIPIENAASKVSSLRAVTGRFKTDEEGTSRAFLIAQDVQAVLPEAVDATNPDKLGVQYTDVIPLLVAAIKELSAKVTALESK